MAVDDRGADDVAGRHRNHARGDAKLAAESLIGADQHERHVEGAADADGLLRRHRCIRLMLPGGAVLLHHRRGPRGEPRHQRLGDALAHPVVGRTSRQVGERHDGHGAPQRAAGPDRGRLRRRRGRRQHHYPQHRPCRRHLMRSSRSHVHQLLVSAVRGLVAPQPAPSSRLVGQAAQGIVRHAAANGTRAQPASPRLGALGTRRDRHASSDGRRGALPDMRHAAANGTRAQPALLPAFRALGTRQGSFVSAVLAARRHPRGSRRDAGSCRRPSFQPAPECDSA